MRIGDTGRFDGNRKTLSLLRIMGVAPFEARHSEPVQVGLWDTRLGFEKIQEAEKAWHEEADGLMRAIKPIAFPHWSLTNELVKATYFQRVIFRQILFEEVIGNAYTLNVNLSAEIEADTKASGSSFLKAIQERVARHLKERLSRRLDFWFGLEVSKAGKPHIHGAFAAHPDELSAIKRALEAASRRRGSPAEPRAVVIRPITDGSGWVAYAIKGTAQTKSVLGSRALTATAHLRKLAQGEYEADQEAYRMATQPERFLPYLTEDPRGT